MSTEEELTADMVRLSEHIYDARQKVCDTTLPEAATKAGIQPLPPVLKGIKPRGVLKGHRGKIYSLQWAADSQHIVSAGQDGKLLVWDAYTGDKVWVVQLASNWVMSCAYSPSGNLLASGGLSNNVSVHNIGAAAAANLPIGEPIQTRDLVGHSAMVSGCQFLSDQQLVSCSGDATCVLWDVDRGQRITSFEAHVNGVNAVALAANKQTFLSAGCDATVRLFDIRDGKCHRTFAGHESDINGVSYFPDGNAFATASDDHSCRLFDIRSDQELMMFLDDRQDTVNNVPLSCPATSVCLSRSGRVLFAGYENFTCGAWDVLTGAKLYDLMHENRVTCVGVSPDGVSLCTGSWDLTLSVWAQ